MKPRHILLSIIATCCLGLGHAAAQDASEVFTKFDKNPMPMRTPPPAYPAGMNGVTGIVSVMVIIDETGTVTQAMVTKSTHTQFEEPSLIAIQRWKFKPAEVDGQPVKAKVTIPLHFNAS